MRDMCAKGTLGAHHSQKIPSRAETKALKAALEANFDLSPLSPPTSPFINRRPLDSRTEARLHEACALIVKGYSPDETEPKLNFDSLHQTAGVQKSYAAPAPNTGRWGSTSRILSDWPSAARPPKNAKSPDVNLRYPMPESRSAQDLVYPTLGRRHEQPRAGAGSQDAARFPPRLDSFAPRRVVPLGPNPMSPTERPRTAPVDSSEVSYATPKSVSTGHFNYASTAITSAALTPSRPSKHASKQFILDPDSYQAAISEADTEAAVWMRSELERRAKQAQETEAPQPPPTRSANRGWSFRDELREAVRPRTSSGRSRSVSRDSHSRKTDGQRSLSAQGWRSWGLQRKSSKSSLVERPPSRGRAEATPRDPPQPVQQRKVIDLNRELPPLPSLDTYQEPQPYPPAELHIASLMRTKSKNQSRKSTARDTIRASEPAIPFQSARAVSISRLDPVASTETTERTESAESTESNESTQPAESPGDASQTEPLFQLPTTDAVSVRETDDVERTEAAITEGRRSVQAHSKTNSGDSCFSPAASASPGPHRSFDTNRVSKHVKRKENVQRSTDSLSHQRQPSGSTTSPPTRPITRDGRRTNFSRKISIDNQGRIHESPNANLVEITALPPLPPKKQTFATLRKVLSNFNMKDRNKPVTWMDRFEADGIKVGVMVQTETSPAPIIRY